MYTHMRLISLAISLTVVTCLGSRDWVNFLWSKERESMGSLRESVCSAGVTDSSPLLGGLGGWKECIWLKYTEESKRVDFPPCECAVLVRASRRRWSLRHGLDWNEWSSVLLWALHTICSLLWLILCSSGNFPWRRTFHIQQSYVLLTCVLIKLQKPVLRINILWFLESRW